MNELTSKFLLIFTSLILSIGLISNAKVHAESEAGINIDGYYDDWEDKPMSMLTWNDNSGVAHHDISMVKDDEYIYIYLGLHSSYHGNNPFDDIHLSINDQLSQLYLGYRYDQNTINASFIDINKKGLYTGLYVYSQTSSNALGDAAIVTHLKDEDKEDRDKHKAKLELRINIKELENSLGLSEGTVNNGSIISLQIPNAGSQTIELVGTSSGPILGIVISAGVVGLVLWVRYRKRYEH